MKNMLTLAHYQKALAVFQDPAFEAQKLLLHDLNEEVYRSKKGYTDNGMHFGYVDALVRSINAIPASMGFEYAIILDGPYQTQGISSHHFTNSRFSEATFALIKERALPIMANKLVTAEAEETFFQSHKEEQQHITVPRSFVEPYYLVKVSGDWADEFTADAFAVFSLVELEAWKKSIPEKDVDWSFGTNQTIEYATKEEFLEACEITAIPASEAQMFFKYFSSKAKKNFGWNGRYYNRIETHTVCHSSLFPEFQD